MDIEKALRLESQTLTGEEAEEALPIMRRVFKEARAEIYQQMETDADMLMLRAKLLVMRDIEARLTAYINGGEVARRELKK